MIKYMGYIILTLIIIIFCLLYYIKKERKKRKSQEIRNEKLLSHNQKLNSEKCIMENKIERYKYLNESFACFKSDRAIGIFENKIGEVYLIFESTYGNDLNFYFSGKSCKGVLECPRLLSTIKDTYIWIDDIFAIDENAGNGSKLLECLFTKAKEMNIEEIKGELATIDISKFDKLEYFYRKNGFDVSFNKDRTRGGIIKRLN